MNKKVYVVLIVFFVGCIFFARFLYYYITIPGSRPIQNLIVASIATLLAFQIFIIGLLADLISANRKFIEDILKRVKNLELSGADGK